MTQITRLAHYQNLLKFWVAALDCERDRLNEDLVGLQRAYPSWRVQVDSDSPNVAEHDARPEYFMLLAVILQNVWLGFIYGRDQLCDRQYWRYVEPRFTSEQDMLEAAGGYLTMVRQYSVTQIVSITETTLAAIAMCGRGPFNLTTSTGFENVYTYVLSKLSLSQKFEELFDILRLVRNTIHSNGVYLPRNGEDLVKCYGGKEYTFKVGQPIDWDNGDMITPLFQGMRGAMGEIVSSPAVRGISSVSSFAG